MRMLVIIDLYPPVSLGGAELACAALVHWMRRNHEVLVLTSDRDCHAVEGEAAVRRELPFLAWRRGDRIRAPLATARAAQVTRAALAELDPDLVYVVNTLEAPQVGALLARRAGFPVAYRLGELRSASALHQGDLYIDTLATSARGVRRAWAGLVRIINRHPALRFDPRTPLQAAIAWSSESLRRDAELPAGVVEPLLERVIYPATEHGADFARMERRPAEHTTIAYVGHVTTTKGAEVAYRALAVLRDSYGIQARLVLAGHCTSAMRDRLGGLAGKLGVREWVDLRGRLAPEHVGALMQSAHALVVPSVAHESFSLVCLEGALARVPIVAARIGGIPELLAAGEHALLFEPGDPEACAGALAETLQNPATTAARVSRAFERARELSLERYLHASEKFIADAVAAFREHQAPGAAL